jgi:hypothetical protein
MEGTTGIFGLLEATAAGLGTGFLAGSAGKANELASANESARALGLTHINVDSNIDDADEERKITGT